MIFNGLLYDPESQEETDGTVKYRVIKKSLIKQLIYKVVGEEIEPSRRGVLRQGWYTRQRTTYRSCVVS